MTAVAAMPSSVICVFKRKELQTVETLRYLSLPEGSDAEESGSPPADGTPERRRQPRVVIPDRPATLLVGDTVFPVVLRNLSLFGAYVDSVPVELGEGTEVVLRTTLEEEETIRVHATVIYQCENGAGLRLRGLDRSTVFALIHHLSLAAA
jgi:hypothetical protein